MKTTHLSAGYILILTLSIITLSVAMITVLYNNVEGYLPYAHLAADRQRAQTLAYGSVNVGLSQLATAAQGTQKEKPTAVDHAKELLITLLPVHNQWQTFTLKRAVEGIDGELNVCITSESGKLNINKIYDFKTKKFVGEGQQVDYKKIMTSFFERLTPLVRGVDLFKGFEKFLKERSGPLDDVTELLTIKEFEVFKNSVFYAPATPQSKEGDAPAPLYLTDLFTVWTEKPTIDPWLMSHSWRRLCDVKQLKVHDREKMQELLKKFALETEWNAQSWDAHIKPFYDTSFNAMPEFARSILSNTFAPTTFSVLSHAKVGTITQRLLAIVQRDASAPEHRSAPQTDTSFGVRIKKLYWL